MLNTIERYLIIPRERTKSSKSFTFVSPGHCSTFQLHPKPPTFSFSLLQPQSLSFWSSNQTLYFLPSVLYTCSSFLKPSLSLHPVFFYHPLDLKQLKLHVLQESLLRILPSLIYIKFSLSVPIEPFFYLFLLLDAFRCSLLCLFHEVLSAPLEYKLH